MPITFGRPPGTPQNPSAPRDVQKAPKQVQQELGQQLFGRFAPVATAAADFLTPATPLGTASQAMTQVDPNLALGGTALGLGLGALGMARGRPGRAIRTAEEEVQDFLGQVSRADLTRMMKTARGAGAVGGKPTLVTRAALERVDPNTSVLDFGAGPKANQSRILQEQGFSNVTSTDLPESIERSEGLLRALREGEQFNTVLASNVANVQSNPAEIRSLFRQIIPRVEADGGVIMNFPAEPRPSKLRGRAFAQMAEEFFTDVERVGGSTDAPVLALRGPRPQPLEPIEFGADAFKAK